MKVKEQSPKNKSDNNFPLPLKNWIKLGTNLFFSPKCHNEKYSVDWNIFITLCQFSSSKEHNLGEI